MDLFRGKSKQVWDYLWSVSRGAINPTRVIRKSRKEIKMSSKLGSMVTVDAAIEHLEKIGLLKVIPNIGSSNGNEYEIFTPEEIDLTVTSISSISSNTRYTSLTQKVDDLDIPESGISSITQTIENKTTSDDTKTSLKTNTTDDDGFAHFIEKFQSAAKELTGKKLSKRDSENLEKLADLLVLELKIAARRTGSVSSVPAFLTEILRRKLHEAPKNDKSSKVKIDTVGKSDDKVGSYEIKPLDTKGREEALAHLREFVDDDFLLDFKKWYTDDDWKYFMKELKKQP